MKTLWTAHVVRRGEEYDPVSNRCVPSVPPIGCQRGIRHMTHVEPETETLTVNLDSIQCADTPLFATGTTSKEEA